MGLLNKNKKTLNIKIDVDKDGNIYVDYPTDSNVDFNIEVNNNTIYSTDRKVTFNIPIGDCDLGEAQQQIQDLLRDYNKKVEFNNNGEIKINGEKYKRNFPFQKEYWI